jgi:hypothetical protein
LDLVFGISTSLHTVRAERGALLARTIQKFVCLLVVSYGRESWVFMRLHLLLVTVCSGLIRFVPFLIVRLMRLMIIAAIWVVTRHVGILGRPAVLLSSIRVSGCHECWNKSEGNEVKIEHSRSWSLCHWQCFSVVRSESDVGDDAGFSL